MSDNTLREAVSELMIRAVGDPSDNYTDVMMQLINAHTVDVLERLDKSLNEIPGRNKVKGYEGFVFVTKEQVRAVINNLLKEYRK